MPSARAEGEPNRLRSVSEVSTSRPELSIVVPMYDEAVGVDRFFERLTPVLDRLKMRCEVICVNDGSTDDTLAALTRHHQRNPAVKVLNLSRNFGKDVALSAGIDHASGAAVIPIDADLQDPPELIEQMVAKWREGYDVVYTVRQSRLGDGPMKRLSARLFYRIFDRVTDIPIPRDAGDYRLLDRRVVDVLVRLPERTRFMKGLFAWVGFKQAALPFTREPRSAGASAWSYWKLWNFAIDGITSFSSLPLKVWSYLGLVISLCAFAYAAFLAVLRLTRGIDVPGYTSLMVAMLFLGGVQLITLGVIGEYLGRVYNEVKGRPLYLVRDRIGFDQNDR